MGELPDAQARLIDQATAAAGSASLSDIQHVVILMQENRSFDHYFGTLSGVRGFSDPNITSQSVGGQAAEQAVLNSLAGTLDLGIDYPLPTANSMPSQGTSPARPPVP